MATTLIAPSALNGVTAHLPAPIPDAEIVAKLMRITPEMAKNLLVHRPANRPISKARVRALIDDIRGGRWVVNGESIILDDNGHLLDGQHRLMAVVESGIAIVTLVALGVDRSAMPSVDQGAKKSAADLLHMAEMAHAPQLSAAVKWVWRLDNSAMRRVSIGLRHDEFPAFVAARPGLPLALPWGRAIRAVLSPGCGTALFHAMALKDAAQAASFYKGLADGEELKRDDPAHVVRERLLRDKTPLSHAVIVGRAALLALAWNCVRKQQPLPAGLVWRGLQDKSVPFPPVL